jgi:death-on-curing protein
VNIRYVELADYLAIAAEITGLDTNTLIRVTKVDLAESALHAPAAGFGETEFYPDFIDKAAVLVVRLAKNHPLPDSNKRAAWVTLRLSSRSTTGPGTPSPPSMRPSKRYLLSLLVHGAKTTQATWLRRHLNDSS